MKEKQFEPGIIQGFFKKAFEKVSKEYKTNSIMKGVSGFLDGRFGEQYTNALLNGDKDAAEFAALEAARAAFYMYAWLYAEEIDPADRVYKEEKEEEQTLLPRRKKRHE